eukprot:ctg_652.g421
MRKPWWSIGVRLSISTVDPTEAYNTRAVYGTPRAHLSSARWLSRRRARIGSAAGRVDSLTRLPGRLLGGRRRPSCGRGNSTMRPVYGPQRPVSIDVERGVSPLISPLFGVDADRLAAAIRERDHRALVGWGGVDGLSKRLHTDGCAGLCTRSDNSTALWDASRREHFGENRFRYPAPKPFWRLCWEAWNDLILMLAQRAGAVWVFGGVRDTGGGGVYRGAAGEHPRAEGAAVPLAQRRPRRLRSDGGARRSAAGGACRSAAGGRCGESERRGARSGGWRAVARLRRALRRVGHDRRVGGNAQDAAVGGNLRRRIRAGVGGRRALTVGSDSVHPHHRAGRHRATGATGPCCCCAGSYRRRGAVTGWYTSAEHGRRGAGHPGGGHSRGTAAGGDTELGVCHAADDEGSQSGAAVGGVRDHGIGHTAECGQDRHHDRQPHDRHGGLFSGCIVGVVVVVVVVVGGGERGVPGAPSGVGGGQLAGGAALAGRRRGGVSRQPHRVCPAAVAAATIRCGLSGAARAACRGHGARIRQHPQMHEQCGACGGA